MHARGQTEEEAGSAPTVRPYAFFNCAAAVGYPSFVSPPVMDDVASAEASAARLWSLAAIGYRPGHTDLVADQLAQVIGPPLSR